jgi:hypothetical protein
MYFGNSFDGQITFATVGVSLIRCRFTPYWDSNRKSKEHNSLMSSIEGVHDWYRFGLLLFPLIRTRILTHG